MVNDIFERVHDMDRRCRDQLETCRETHEDGPHKLDRHLQQQLAGEDQLQTSHDKYVACPDQNDRCPGKQRAVPGKTAAGRVHPATCLGKLLAARVAARSSRHISHK